MLFKQLIGLRHETTPDQLRRVLAAVHKLLSEHPRVETDSARVRLVKLGSSSLDLEACAYALATDPQAYLKIQEELLLQIMDAIEGERGDGSISKPDAALRGTDTGTPTSRRA